jgi:hypothetical protein
MQSDATLHLFNTQGGMSVHQKLMQARIALQGKKLSKSGKNKFAGYNYFELGDFLPTVQEIFLSLELSGVVSYGKEEATLTVTDCSNPDDCIEISSPMSSAALKGAHEIQNLGAVQTYLRRYLWVTAMEIVEHDALDAVLGSDAGTSAPKSAPAARKPVDETPGGLPASAAFAPTSVNEKLETKLMDLGITQYGIKTVLTITESLSLAEIPENKATALLKAVGKDHIKMFNQGKNSKGAQIIPEPVSDKINSKSIDDLAKAAEDAFGDD